MGIWMDEQNVVRCNCLYSCLFNSVVTYGTSKLIDYMELELR